MLHNIYIYIYIYKSNMSTYLSNISFASKDKKYKGVNINKHKMYYGNSLKFTHLHICTFKILL